MANRKRVILFGAAATLVGAITLLILGVVMRDRSIELRRSVDALLQEKLGLRQTSISQESLAGSNETDPNGFWVVALNGNSIPLNALTASGFRKSDKNDELYFRASMEKALGKEIPHRYQSFEGNFSLGEGTICPSVSCNIVLFTSVDEPTLYIVIWKI